jgi:hypothetical protein
MNRQYISKAEIRPLSKVEALAENTLCIFDCLIEFFSDKTVQAGLRMLAALFSFFAFIFVVGAVEAETITLGSGVLLSIMLFSLSFIAVYGIRSQNSH